MCMKFNVALKFDFRTPQKQNERTRFFLELFISIEKMYSGFLSVELTYTSGVGLYSQNSSGI